MSPKLSFVVLISLLTSCSDEFFYQEVRNAPQDLDQDKLVIYGLLSTQDSVVRISITKTLPYWRKVSGANAVEYFSFLGEESGTSVEARVTNATVEINNGETTYLLPFVGSTGLYQMESSKLKIIEGMTYSLLVTAEGYGQFTTSCTVPPKTHGVEGSIRAFEDIDVDGYKTNSLELKLSWREISDLNEFYEVKADLIDTADRIVEIGRYDSLDNYVLEDIPINDQYSVHFPISLLSDNLTEDGQMVTRGTASSHYYYHGNENRENTFPEVMEINAMVFSLDEHMFKFLSSYQNSEEDSPFIEPVPLYSNIDGAIGIFGAFTSITFNSIVEVD